MANSLRPRMPSTTPVIAKIITTGAPKTNNEDRAKIRTSLPMPSKSVLRWPPQPAPKGLDQTDARVVVVAPRGSFALCRDALLERALERPMDRADANPIFLSQLCH